MQFSAIVSEVGNLTSSLSSTRDKLFVNEAYHDILSHRRWSFLASTTSVALVAGQRGYVVLGTSPVITDFDGPISVTIEVTAGGWRKKLPRVDPQTFEDWFAHSSTNGDPVVWTIQGGTAATTSATVVQGGQQSIILGPPPVATAGHGVNMLLRYWRSAASIEMSADTDIPIIPTQYHNLIITRACAIAMERNVMLADAAGYQQSYEKQLAAMVDTDQAMYSGDNTTLILMPPIDVPNQAPLTQADYNRSSRPLPAGV